jgi:pimeloyl-ACP methyl ester carboxylesterase
MKSELVRTAAGPIEYTLRGQGGAVVLVCHGTSSDCHSVEASRPLVAAGLRVLTPSRPGYGRTPLSAGASAADASRAFISLLDALGIQRCRVVATSGGGPTGIALAASFPQRVERLILAEAITRPEDRPNEAAYQTQVSFYGPMHPVMWGLLGLMSRLSPRSIARQTLAIFSTHDPDDALGRLSAADIQDLARFYHGHSSRRGALNDLTHSVGQDVLAAVGQPTLVIHSREDKSVPFAHAEWALAHIPHGELCEAGFTGHFFWIGPDFARVAQQMQDFLRGSTA